MPRGSHTGALIPEEKLKRFLNAYVNCGFNAVQAGIAMCMSKRSAQANFYRYVEAIRSRLSMQHAMRESGLDVRFVARKLARSWTRPRRSGTWQPANGTRSTITRHRWKRSKQTARLRNLYPAAPPKGRTRTGNRHHSCSALRNWVVEG
jgi:hypothetical protein